MPVSSPLASSERLARALAHLAQTIDARALENQPDSSWTAKLLALGPEGAAAKVSEESDELVRALAGESEQRVASEAADLIYHMFVALRARGIALDEVAGALERRQGQSGLDEKASRPGGAGR